MYIIVKSFTNRTFIYESTSSGLTGSQIKHELYRREGIPVQLQQLHVGRLQIADDDVLSNSTVAFITLSLPGGKGGFGSMLRAIGAQIEKTTNREACRDLSGRRLRDINEEKRLKEWISKQAEREKDMQRKKIEKLERMKAKPKHEFHDPEYDLQRSELPEQVTDAVLEGLKRDSQAMKRKPNTALGSAKKKNCLWLGAEELEDDDSDISEEEENKSDQKNVSVPLIGDSDKPDDCAKKASRLTLDLSQFDSVDQLQALGGEVLSSTLTALGAKSGGTIEQKAERLWAFKGKGTLKKLSGPADIVL